VQLERALGALEARPGKDRQAQVDGRGIERVDGLGEAGAEGVVGVEAARDADERLGEVGIDPPVAAFVGIGQRAPRDRSADTHVVELGMLGAQAGFDVAQALAIGELRKGHAQILVETAEALELVLAAIARDAASQAVQRQVADDLRENEPAGIHLAPPPRLRWQGRRNDRRSSSR